MTLQRRTETNRSGAGTAVPVHRMERLDTTAPADVAVENTTQKTFLKDGNITTKAYPSTGERDTLQIEVSDINEEISTCRGDKKI